MFNRNTAEPLSDVGTKLSNVCRDKVHRNYQRAGAHCRESVNLISCIADWSLGQPNEVVEISLYGTTWPLKADPHLRLIQ